MAKLKQELVEEEFVNTDLTPEEKKALIKRAKEAEENIRKHGYFSYEEIKRVMFPKKYPKEEVERVRQKSRDMDRGVKVDYDVIEMNR